MLSPRKHRFLMPRSRSQITSSLRRQRKANRLLFTGIFVIRPCAYYSTRGFLYILRAESPHCERYYRANRQCELAPPDTEIERLLKQKRKLFGETKKAQAKAIRLSKQRRAILKRVRDLSERKDQNILKLELNKMVKLKSFSIKGTEEVIPKINEISSEAPAEPAEILNPFSPRSSSFLNSALLNSPDRILVELLSNQ
jgi:hypothetical protein